jgi:hypothetical protein
MGPGPESDPPPIEAEFVGSSVSYFDRDRARNHQAAAEKTVVQQGGTNESYAALGKSAMACAQMCGSASNMCGSVCNMCGSVCNMCGSVCNMCGSVCNMCGSVCNMCGASGAGASCGNAGAPQQPLKIVLMHEHHAIVVDAVPVREERQP